MIIAVLVVIGLILGSFVNALVWRLHEQEEQTPASQNLSILKGRSLCPNCRHQLAAKDLVPVLSWLFLRGKCRYCSQPIAKQYPLVELLTAGLFVASYLWWPLKLHGLQTVIFGLWLVFLTGLIALLLYDWHWKVLPDRISFLLAWVGLAIAILSVISATQPAKALLNVVLAVIIGGGIFYVLFQLSGGRWIGGGDVKLGFLLGLVAATPAKALLIIFLASIGGSLISLPLIMSNKLKRSSTIPFGPFLIAGAIITVLFGTSITNWYGHIFMLR